MTGIGRDPYSDPNGDIYIRNMVKEDADFAGKMTVESFRSKFEWAAGKRRYKCYHCRNKIKEFILLGKTKKYLFLAWEKDYRYIFTCRNDAWEKIHYSEL